MRNHYVTPPQYEAAKAAAIAAILDLLHEQDRPARIFARSPWDSNWNEFNYSIIRRDGARFFIRHNVNSCPKLVEMVESLFPGAAIEMTSADTAIVAVKAGRPG